MMFLSSIQLENGNGFFKRKPAGSPAGSNAKSSGRRSNSAMRRCCCTCCIGGNGPAICCVLSSEDMLGETLDQLINASSLYPVVIVLFMLSTAAGTRLGVWHHKRGVASEIGTLTAAGLGLLALLLAFSLAHALSRFEARRDLILDEAIAIESTANLAAML